MTTQEHLVIAECWAWRNNCDVILGRERRQEVPSYAGFYHRATKHREIVTWTNSFTQTMQNLAEAALLRN